MWVGAKTRPYYKEGGKGAGELTDGCKMESNHVLVT